jgi:SAM-dependent methyltransferase
MSDPIPSPNIWGSPDVYEIENLGVDRAGVIEAAQRRIADWAGKDVVDLGCGTGFHLARFASTARSVVGVEPHPPLAALARQRISGMPRASVIEAGAESLPVADGSFDIAHARWAYFFGPGCEPGLTELARVMRPGGTAYVIDNDATRSTFGAWFRRALPAYDARAVERFWERRGWQRERLDIRWDFDSRADFEAVVRIEFAPAQAELILAEHPGATGVDYAVNLWWRHY